MAIYGNPEVYDGGSVMATISEFKEFFGEWIAAVAGAVDVVADRVCARDGSCFVEGDDGAFTATTAPTKNGPALPTCRFASIEAGLIRRCRRIGKRPFAAPASRPSCNPTMS